MRILHVVPTYYPAVRYGGPIRSVHGLCAALVARGHDVHVFTTNVDGPGDSDVPLGTAIDLDSVKVSYFPSRWMRRFYWSPPLGSALRRDVAAFDIVHLHSVFLWPTWAAARAARSARVPYVLSPRGMMVKDLIRARSRIAKAAWLALAEKSNLVHAAAIHATSPREEADLREFRYPLQGRIFVIPNGVNTTNEPPVSSLASPPYLLMLGRLNWKKRIDMAIEALPLLPGIRLVIAGGDDEGITGTLRGRALSLGVMDRVEFIGHVDDQSKGKLLREALALVMPSISENFGNSALEALAVGTPAIVVPQVGLADTIMESGCGFVVPPTAEGIANAVRQLQVNPALRRQMGERAWSAARSQYSWNAIGARMEVEYEKLLNSRRLEA